VKFGFLRRISKNKGDFGMLIRIITDYLMIKAYLFRMNIVDFPSCKYGELIQSINYIFWACPLLEFERFKMYRVLRELNMLNPFSIEYLMGNLNKKIAAIIVIFIKIVSIKLEVFI